MLIATQLLLGLLIPALVAGAVVYWGARSSPSPAATPRGAWWTALGLGAGYGAGHAGLFGWPPFPAIDVSDWLPWLAAGAVALELLEGAPRPRQLAWIARGLQSAAVPWLILRPLFQSWENPLLLALVMASLAAALFSFLTALVTLAKRRPGASLPFHLAATAASTGAVVLLSGSARLSQLSGALAAALGATLLVAWRRPPFSLARGALTAGVILAAIWTVGGFYAEVPAASGLCLALAPLSSWLAEAKRARQRAWMEALLSWAAPLVFLALALAWAWHASPPFSPGD